MSMHSIPQELCTRIVALLDPVELCSTALLCREFSKRNRINEAAKRLLENLGVSLEHLSSRAWMQALVEAIEYINDSTELQPRLPQRFPFDSLFVAAAYLVLHYLPSWRSQQCFDWTGPLHSTQLVLHSRLPRPFSMYCFSPVLSTSPPYCDYRLDAWLGRGAFEISVCCGRMRRGHLKVYVDDVLAKPSFANDDKPALDGGARVHIAEHNEHGEFVVAASHLRTIASAAFSTAFAGQHKVWLTTTDTSRDHRALQSQDFGVSIARVVISPAARSQAPTRQLPQQAVYSFSYAESGLYPMSGARDADKKAEVGTSGV
jgi:hypothetical protein